MEPPRVKAPHRIHERGGGGCCPYFERKTPPRATSAHCQSSKGRSGYWVGVVAAASSLGRALCQSEERVDGEESECEEVKGGVHFLRVEDGLDIGG